MLSLLALNKLGTTDIIFFVVLGAVVLLAVAVYFLIPVFNKKQYQEMRDNLKKREEAFKANASVSLGASEDNATAAPQTSEKENSDE